MRIDPVPAAFRYHCDFCGGNHLQENALGHYTDSTPPGWVSFRIVAMDRGGDKSRDEKILLCAACVESTRKRMFNGYQDKLLIMIFGEALAEKVGISKSAIRREAQP